MELVLVGDVNLAGRVNQELRRRPAASVWGDTLALFEAADLRVCNLECTFADRGRRWLWPFKKYHHRSDERNVAALTAAGVDIAVLANNHTFDYGADGLRRTLATLDAAGIAHAGAGERLVDAEAPAIRTVTGRRVAVVAFTDDERWGTAGPASRGRFYSPVRLGHPRADRVLDAVRRARPHVDVLIASAHWGPNLGDDPPPAQRPFAHALIEAGADLVFGHSSHVLRGVEVHRGRPVLYGAGDLVHDYRANGRDPTDHGGIFSLTWSDGAFRRLRLDPIVIRDAAAWRADTAEARQIRERVRRLCASLGTDVVESGSGLEIVLGR